MKETALMLVLVMTLAGCGGEEVDPRAAQQMKQQVDAAVYDVAPRLVDELGGEIKVAGAMFLSCDMSSDQKYVASVGVVGGTSDADSAVTALEDAGFEDISVGTSGDTVTARKGQIEVRVPLTSAHVSNVEIFVDCTPLDDAGQEFADDDDGEKFGDLLG